MRRFVAERTIGVAGSLGSGLMPKELLWQLGLLDRLAGRGWGR